MSQQYLFIVSVKQEVREQLPNRVRTSDSDRGIGRERAVFRRQKGETTSIIIEESVRSAEIEINPRVVLELQSRFAD